MIDEDLTFLLHDAFVRLPPKTVGDDVVLECFERQWGRVREFDVVLSHALVVSWEDTVEIGGFRLHEVTVTPDGALAMDRHESGVEALRVTIPSDHTVIEVSTEKLRWWRAVPGR